MTYLDVVFSYGSLPGENELRAIDSMREVYGVRRVCAFWGGGATFVHFCIRTQFSRPLATGSIKYHLIV